MANERNSHSDSGHQAEKKKKVLRKRERKEVSQMHGEEERRYRRGGVEQSEKCLSVDELTFRFCIRGQRCVDAERRKGNEKK